MKRNYFSLLFLIALIFFTLNTAVFAIERSVIIGFHKKPGVSEKEMVYNAQGHIKRNFNLIPAIAARMPEKEIANLLNNPNVAYVEEDVIITTADEYSDSWGVQHIGSETVHINNIKGTGVKIAVIDTGIDYTHEDLNDNYKGGYDFVFDDDDPFDDSYDSHGSHVAGIIAAEKNGIGVVGVAPEAWLYAVKVLDGAGFGLLSDLIAGIEWAVDNEMDIANISMGTSLYFQSLQDACDNAYSKGVLLVAAAGNTYGGDVSYPARYDSVIAVTATDINDQRAGFSPIGLEVELAAPGVGILSTSSDNGYAYLTGTSEAAPHVTGTAALAISSGIQDMNGDGIVDNKDIRLKLHQTALDLGKEGKDNEYGYGLVDASKAALETSETQTITVIRTRGGPFNDKQSITLYGNLYQIIINNKDLKKIDVKVSENNIVRPDLSTSYNFGGKKPQEVIFYLDVNSTTFDVDFIPYGKLGASAEVIITKQSL